MVNLKIILEMSSLDDTSMWTNIYSVNVVIAVCKLMEDRINYCLLFQVENAHRVVCPRVFYKLQVLYRITWVRTANDSDGKYEQI